MAQSLLKVCMALVTRYAIPYHQNSSDLDYLLKYGNVFSNENNSEHRCNVCAVHWRGAV